MRARKPKFSTEQRRDFLATLFPIAARHIAGEKVVAEPPSLQPVAKVVKNKHQWGSVKFCRNAIGVYKWVKLRVSPKTEVEVLVL